MLSRSAQHPVYLFLDDKCPYTSGITTPREEALQLVKSFIDLRLQDLYICVTSLLGIDIRTTFKPLTSLYVSLYDQGGQKQDIVDNVNSVVYSDTKIQRRREELLVDTLSDGADDFDWYTDAPALRVIL
ncbi:hypothetical protein BC826DRAFT_1103421 [Russula brevipes]|nr:hypothetical protein BC826DRAFT_1103421 [Russula brevipes]